MEERNSSVQAEVDKAYIVVVKSFSVPNSYLLRSADPFTFNFSFLILSNIISNTDDCAKRDFSFLFRKSAVLVPRPHQKSQNFDCGLVNSNSTPTFGYNLLI